MRPRYPTLLAAATLGLFSQACGPPWPGMPTGGAIRVVDYPLPDGGEPEDAGRPDAGPDAGSPGAHDAGAPDSGTFLGGEAPFPELDGGPP